MNAFLCLDKEEGISSFKVTKSIQTQLFKTYKQKIKCGHTGTLDPFATGLMVIGLNEALKYLHYLSLEPKVYLATLKLGQKTDTLDHEGNMIDEKKIPSDLSLEKIKEVSKNFLGLQEQLPPMYSAKKIQGQRLYKLARKGIEVERKSSQIRVDSFDILDFSEDSIMFRVSVSTGTYVRVLAADFAERLSTVGHLSSLRREKVGYFDLSQSSSDGNFKMISIKDALSHYPTLDLSNSDLDVLRKGQILNRDQSFEDGLYVLTNHQDFVGMGELCSQNLKAKRLMSF